MMTQRRPTVRIKAFSLMLRFLLHSRPLDDFICKSACAPIRRRRREPKPRESPAAKLVLPKVPSVRKTPSSSSGERWEEIGIPLCNIHRAKNSPAILWWKESKLSTFTGLYGINTASYIPELLNAISRWNFGQFWNFTTGIYDEYCIQTRLLFFSVTTPQNLKTNVSVESLNSWNTTVLNLSDSRDF